MVVYAPCQSAIQVQLPEWMVPLVEKEQKEEFLTVWIETWVDHWYEGCDRLEVGKEITAEDLYMAASYLGLEAKNKEIPDQTLGSLLLAYLGILASLPGSSSSQPDHPGSLPESPGSLLELFFAEPRRA